MDKKMIERAVEAAARCAYEGEIRARQPHQPVYDLLFDGEKDYWIEQVRDIVTAVLDEVEASNRVTIQRLDDFESLRGRLDDLNESGAHSDLVLLDAHGAPALVGLSGPYAEGTFAVRGNPWDRDIDWGGDCSHCGAQSGAMSSAETLDFPVYVVKQEDK